MNGKIIRTKKVKAEIAKWVETLRSGEFGQTQGALQKEDGFCCLGVACKVFIPAKKLILKDDEEGLMYGEMPNDQDHAPKWLKEIDSDFEDRIGFNLPSLNDYFVNIYAENDDQDDVRLKSLTFNEIADLIQLIYLEGALG
jgi:hypothetical protein